MPRGRAGLGIIPPAEVARVIFDGFTFWFHRSRRRARRIAAVAERFGVSPRTVRRWLDHGLAPGYAGTNPSREEWAAFERETCQPASKPVRPTSPAPSRPKPVNRGTAVDRKLSTRRLQPATVKSRRIRRKLSRATSRRRR